MTYERRSIIITNNITFKDSPRAFAVHAVLLQTELENRKAESKLVEARRTSLDEMAAIIRFNPLARSR